MIELTNLIYFLRCIKDDLETVETIHYHLITHVFRPYIQKQNCGYIWRRGQLVSKQVKAHYNKSLEIITPSQVILPRYGIFCEKTHSMLSDSKFPYNLPMMIHFALFYHHRNAVIGGSFDDDVEFLMYQVPGFTRPMIRNAYQFAIDTGMCIKEESEYKKFNLKKNPYKEVMVNNVT